MSAPRQPSPPPVLEAESVSRSYRLGASLVTAIQDVSLSVASGELIALKGPSGSGKTTLLNLMGLLDRPDAGVVRVGGVEAEGWTRTRARTCGATSSGLSFRASI